jgi:hypothetical protein
LTKRTICLPSDGPRLFEIVSYGRSGPKPPGRFSRAEIDQIARTVRHIPEVMVKVTGGGTRGGAVAAHFAYISRRGALEIETDEGERIGRRDEQKRLLEDWHLELTAGQYRWQVAGGPPRRPAKLVHNVVLSMPAPTPPDKVLNAARKFAREKFASHRSFWTSLDAKTLEIPVFQVNSQTSSDVLGSGDWCRLRDSNPRPTVYKTVALPLC